MKEKFFERTRKKVKHHSVSHYPEMQSESLKDSNQRFISLELFRMDLKEGRRMEWISLMMTECILKETKTSWLEMLWIGWAKNYYGWIFFLVNEAINLRDLFTFFFFFLWTNHNKKHTRELDCQSHSTTFYVLNR